MIALRTIACCVFASIGLATTPERPSPQPQTTSILHATIVSVTDGLILTNQTINIEGRTIRSVAANGPPLTGARIVDATGRFVIPGLWDMHAHLEFTGASSLQLYVANGVTGVRDMGSSLDTVLGYRESTQSGVVLGPRIVAAGPSLRQPGTDASPYRTHQLWVDTAADGRAVVQMLKGRGVDFIKVHGQVSRDAYFAIAEEARAQGLPLVGHLPDKITFDEAIDAGQIGFEHMNDMAIWTACSGPTVYREESCRAYFEGLGRRGIWETPTLLAYRERLSPNAPASETGKEQLAYATRSLKEYFAWLHRRLPPDPQIIAMLRSTADVAAVAANDLAKRGVGILAGCDVMMPGFCVHDELALMVRGGMSTLSALQTATINPARFLGLTRTLGTVAADKDADLVLLDANPLIDIANLKRIRAVVVRGRMVDRPDLDAVLSAVRAAAPTQ
jgi:hypothetical protein